MKHLSSTSTRPFGPGRSFGRRRAPFVGRAPRGVRRASRRGPFFLLGAVLACSAVTVALSGCSGQRSYLLGRPTTGQLKTTLSHLEYENAQLKSDMAKLQRENRAMEDRLVQEELDNGDLAARLDDARNLLRDRGQGAGARGGRFEGDDDRFGVRTLPAGRSTRRPRKPPVARIPGQIEPALPDPGEGPGSERDLDDFPQSGAWNFEGREDLDHHSFRDGPSRWSPLVRKPLGAETTTR